jgi:hypothetical protein
MPEFRVEIRALTDGEQIDQGAIHTDVACGVWIDGKLVAYTDDYGSATVLDRRRAGHEGVVNTESIEMLVEKAGDVWAETCGSGHRE